MISFSQNFEDVILARVFRDRARGSYVDVGAHLPVIDSVTEHFYRSGWRGINIEPLEAAYSELLATRPDDININCAIAAADGSARFFALDGFSTLEPGIAEAHRVEGRSSAELTVRTLTLTTVLERAGLERVDFLKIDVEGAENTVLRSNDWTRFRPSLVLVEAIHPVTRAASHTEWEWILLEAGYEFMHFDGLNRFYWDAMLPKPDANCFLPPNVLDNFTSYPQIAAEARAAEAIQLAQYDRQHLARVEADAAELAKAEAARLARIDAALRQLAQGADEPAPDEAVATGWRGVVQAREADIRARAAREAALAAENEGALKAAVSAHEAGEAARLAGIDSALARLAQSGEGPAPSPLLDSGWRALIAARKAAGEAYESAEQARLRGIDAALQRLAAGRPEPLPDALLTIGWKTLMEEGRAARAAQADTSAAVADLQARLAESKAAFEQQDTLLRLSEQRRLALLELRGCPDAHGERTDGPSTPSVEGRAAAPLPPALSARHIDSGARLHASRHDLLRALSIAPGGTIAEVGVALGDFSLFLMGSLAPTCFVAFDTFDMHTQPEHWGTPSEALFDGLTHEAFFKRRCSEYSGILTVEVGDSQQRLPSYPDEHFDLIYIDAGHTYDHVKQDSVTALRKLKTGGTLIFNDYTMYDPYIDAAYGVVQAVNELVIEHDLRVTGFGLQQAMFCDIAVCKDH